MKLIYMIFISTCLTEKLKADGYNVEIGAVFGSDGSLASVRQDDDKTVFFTFQNDANQKNMKVNVGFINDEWESLSETELDDYCNTDPSTEQGTLAAILWTTIGVDSCQIAAGEYVAVREFNQSGTIGAHWEDISDWYGIAFELQSKEGGNYFTLVTDIHVVEGKQLNREDR